MPSTLTAPQREELKTLLLAKQHELQAQMVQNEQNLVPPNADVGAVLQLNEAREVNQALTNIDAADLGRIDLALKAMDDGSCKSSHTPSTAWLASRAGKPSKRPAEVAGA